MSDLLGLAGRDVTEIAGIGPGNSDDGSPRAEAANGLASIPIAALAEQARFAFGPAEEKRIAALAGFRFWLCNADEGYLHTHPIMGETNAVMAFPVSSGAVAAVSALIRTRSALAPEVEYAMIVLPQATPLQREALDKIIDRAVQGGGSYAGADAAAVVAVIPAETDFRLELEVPPNLARSGWLVLSVRPAAADVVDHAFATWSDLQVVCRPPALPGALSGALTGLVDSSALERSVLDDIAALFDRSWYTGAHPAGVLAALRDDADLLEEYLTSSQDSRWGPGAHPLFDAVHYARQVPQHKRQVHPLVHYLASGWRAGLSPHPLFDPAFYAGQVDCGERPPLLHYLQEGWKSGLSPQPLFCPDWFIRTAGLAEPLSEAPLVTYLRGDHDGDCHAHPLFDAVHYASQVPQHERQVHPLVHYLTSGWRAGLLPHPLFDPAFYAGQVDCGERPPLLHYLQEGWKSGLSPQPLFCPDWFIRTAGLAEPLSEAPLVTYLRGDHDGDPHYLFDTLHYRRFLGHPIWAGNLMGYVGFSHSSPLPEPATTLGQINPLVHYVQFGSRSRQSPHFLFDPEWYAAQRQEVHGLQPPPGDWDPLTDYLETGVRHRLSPSRLVDVEYYAAQTSLADGEDCVGHYMLGEQKDRVSLTPAMDARYYTLHAPEALAAKSPLHHLLCTPAEERKKPIAFFDPEFYLAEYPDLDPEKVCPIAHFVCFGAGEGRTANAIASELYSATHIISNPADLARPHYGYLRAGLDQRVRLLFTSHEASRSGAPAIILSLIRGFAEHGHAECITILDRGGELLEEFKRHSHVMLMSKSVLDVGPRSDIQDRDIEGLMELLGDNRPVVAFINSAESRHIGRRLARYGIPVISLIHETPGYYPVEVFELIYRSSRRVVFPSAYIEDSARGLCPCPEGLAVVRGQGLLRPGFGHLDREQARRKVFQELGLGSDAALVIGCGAVNFRKGADLFLSTAAVLDKRLQDKPGARPVFFCWLGSGPDCDDLQREVERSRMGHVISFVGPRSDVERYFVAGDVFALTSRSDPYPCVVHEAMAAGMPVVGFEGGGGAVELFSPDAGETVAFGDTEAMAEAIEALVFDDARRLEVGRAARRTIAERGSNEAYFQHIKALAGEVTGLDLEHRLGQRRTRSGRKVFFLAPDWGVSGVNRFAETLVNGLNRRGFDAEILFTRGRFSHWETDQRGRIALPDAPYSRLEPNRNTAAGIWQELQRFLADQAPCVIIPNYDYVASAITPVLSSNVGVMGILHSDDVEHYEHGYRLGQYWNRIVAVSEQIARRMLEYNPAFKDRLSILRYGITPLPEVDVAARFPSGDDAIQLVYTGRFERYQKAIQRYVALADLLALRRIRARLVMCGGGGEYAAVKSAMGRHIQAGRVELTGRIAAGEVSDILLQSHAFVLLSDFEGMPLSMLEAMEAGCVPIVYDMESGIPEVVRSGDNGLIVPHGDLAGVVEAIAALRADRQAWCRMAAAARRTIRDLKLTADDMADGYAAAISDVFRDIEAGEYRRPVSIAYRAQIDGVLPPPALYDAQGALRI